MVTKRSAHTRSARARSVRRGDTPQASRSHSSSRGGNAARSRTASHGGAVHGYGAVHGRNTARPSASTKTSGALGISGISGGRASRRHGGVAGPVAAQHSAHTASSVRAAAGGPTPRNPKADGARMLLTRRNLIIGAIGLGGAAAVGGGAYLATHPDNERSGARTLEVSQEAVLTNDDFEQVEWDDRMSLSVQAELDYGSLVWCSDPNLAVCLLPTEAAKPLTQVGLLALKDGSCDTVLERAVGQDEGFEIYDARGTSSGLIWTEADILDGAWRVYTAALSGHELGEPALVAQGGSDWETPSLAAVGTRAFWQLLPCVNGPLSTSDSTLVSAAFGSTESSVVYTSHGRMATPPYALQDSVVITPRLDSSSTYYQLTRIDAESGAVLDAMTLPAAMKPLEAGYGETGFTFAFDAIYDYGEGISNLGTYAPRLAVEAKAPAFSEAARVSAANGDALDGEAADANAASNADANNDAYSDVPWFCFNRTPSAAPAWCGDYLMVKSTSAVVGVDLASEQYFACDVASGSADYGEYIASTGCGAAVVTYANIDYAPVSGTAQKLCRVRVWTPKA